MAESTDFKSHFIQIASHQLRTPLTGITWSLESLLSGENGEVSAKQKAIIHDAWQSNKYVNSVLDDMLLLSEFEEIGIQLRFERINFSELIQQSLTEINVLAKASNIVLKCQSCLEQHTTFGDRLYIRKVIDSFLDNAIRYGKPRGRVTISSERTNNHFVIKCKDNGIGIPVAEQPHIFEKFFRASNAIRAQSQGSGLDLCLSKLIIEAHGGTMSFKSVPGKGSTFSFTLPFFKTAPRGVSRKKVVMPIASTLDQKHSYPEHEFIAIVVHELKAPLNIIRWSAELLRDHDDQPLTKYQITILDQIQRANQRLTILVNDLLQFSQIQQGSLLVEPVRTPLTLIVNDRHAAFNIAAEEKKITLKLKAPTHSAFVMADQNRLGQVLTNIVSNAIKYTPEKGSVAISLKEVSARQLQSLAKKFTSGAIVHYDNKKGYWVIAVRDSGVGISAAEQKRLFSKFFRSRSALRSETEGTGLGLYITKTLIDKQAGDIWFSSVLGKGSTFFISIPKA
jgi:signal transduction histidine kinase